MSSEEPSDAIRIEAIERHLLRDAREQPRVHEVVTLDEPRPRAAVNLLLLSRRLLSRRLLSRRLLSRRLRRDQIGSARPRREEERARADQVDDASRVCWQIFELVVEEVVPDEGGRQR